MKSLSQNIIEHAKRLYPVSLHYRGKFTDKQYDEIEKQCEIHCSSVYMDGSGMYCIRYKAESEEWVNFADDLIPIIDKAESEDT